MLTALAIENAKPKEKPYKLSDGNGLHLLIPPSGSRLWRFRYRFGGKQLMLGLGAFPEVLLADARQKRDEARKLLANGIDPSQKCKEDKLASVQIRSFKRGWLRNGGEECAARAFEAACELGEFKSVAAGPHQICSSAIGWVHMCGPFMIHQRP